MSNKGFRVPPAPSKNEQMRNIDTELKNLQMAGRVSQMMIQQLLTNIKSMGDDLGYALNQVSELQYKQTALQKFLKCDAAALDKIANEQRLVDFDKGSAEQDKKDNLTTAEAVSSDSTVTLTSEAKDEAGNDRGIFRSRIKLSESGSPDLIAQLTGKTVGAKVQVKLNGVDHVVELLSIRNPVVAEVTAEAQH